MTTTESSICAFDTERTTVAPFTGSYQVLGTPLTRNPVIMVFDNQSTVAVEVSADGTNTWHTFPAGEAYVLDLRANHGNAQNYTVPIGTQFWVRGTGGTGQFSLSINYARVN